MNQDQMKASDVRAIAFYLPQFHPIPENDAWWGAGFTEWTNVTKAQPNFVGHEQPRLPADLGFYDLRLPEVRWQQADLARAYGIHGFCYYYYWFGGKRLLQRPLEEMLATGEPDFPFCLCWANENWTRRWDGLEEDVLMAQRYSTEDYRQLIRELLPALRDPRYIRVNGRPLLLVYRVELIPDPRALVAIWREECQRAGVGEPYLCAVRDTGNGEATAAGFDAGVIFPPSGCALPNVNDQVEVINPDFNGYIVDYEAYAEGSSVIPATNYPLFGGVMPQWDNTARRQNNGWIFRGATPEAYQRWLGRITEQTIARYQGEERLLFINAWNEWAEGAHLEPDHRYGHRFLAATRDGLQMLLPAPTTTTSAERELSAWQRLQARIITLEERLGEKERENVELSEANTALHQALQAHKEQLAQVQASLQGVTGSKAWRVAEMLWKLRRRFARGLRH